VLISEIYKFKKNKMLNLKVYKYLQSIPKGKVVTYGQIAEDLGN